MSASLPHVKMFIINCVLTNLGEDGAGIDRQEKDRNSTNCSGGNLNVRACHNLG